MRAPAVFSLVLSLALVGCGESSSVPNQRMEIVATVATGGTENLVVASGAIWAIGQPLPPNGRHASALRIDPASGTLVATIGPGGPSYQTIAAGQNEIWLTSGSGSSGECDGVDDEDFEPGTRAAYVDGKPSTISSCDGINDGIARLDPGTNTIKDQTPFADWLPHAVAVTAEGLWIVASGPKETFLARRAPGSKIFARISNVDEYQLQPGFGSLWTIGGKGVRRIDTISGNSLAFLALKNPREITIGPDAVWATTETGVVRIDPKTNSITAQIPVADSWGVAADERRILVTGFRTHKLHRIDPATNAVVETLDLPAPSAGSAVPATTDVVLAGGDAWVANGDIIRVSFSVS